MSALAAAPAFAADPFTVSSGAPRALAKFRVTYTGSGSYATQFHATPPNAGGRPDHNDARDSSTQRWNLQYRTQLWIPTCAPAADGADPCATLTDIYGASGRWTLTGRIRHKHVDGLDRRFDEKANCDVRLRTTRKFAPFPGLLVAYDAPTQTIALTAIDPTTGALTVLDPTCPGRTRPIDRILDNYFTPGFSFSLDYGPDRWFRSATIRIPAATYLSAGKITIPLRRTSPGKSPRNCAVKKPAYERCRTGGDWSGVLTLSAVG